MEHGFEPRVFPFDGYWNDIGSFRAYVETHVAMGEASVPEKFLAIELGNSFEGVNYIDPSCEIRDSKIKDSIILQNTIIVNCDIHSSIIDKNCEFHNLELYQTPKLRFKNELTEHKTFFLQDPFYNIIELKFYRHYEAIFGANHILSIGDR